VLDKMVPQLASCDNLVNRIQYDMRMIDLAKARPAQPRVSRCVCRYGYMKTLMDEAGSGNHACDQSEVRMGYIPMHYWNRMVNRRGLGHRNSCCLVSVLGGDKGNFD
jgi:hypothetical protein